MHSLRHRLSTISSTAARLCAVVLVAGFASSPSFAQSFPNCSSSAADPDGDGFGWENNRTCAVQANAPAAQSSSSAAFPFCSSASVADGFGWGWENNRSCVVAGSGAAAQIGITGTASNNATTQQNSTAASSQAFPFCSSASVADGFGSVSYTHLTLPTICSV